MSSRQLVGEVLIVGPASLSQITYFWTEILSSVQARARIMYVKCCAMSTCNVYSKQKQTMAFGTVHAADKHHVGDVVKSGIVA